MNELTIAILALGILNLFGIGFMIYKLIKLEKQIKNLESKIEESRLHTKKIIEILNAIIKRMNSNPISFN